MVTVKRPVILQGPARQEEQEIGRDSQSFTVHMGRFLN